MANLIQQLRNYRLTTANILYHMPDHPHLLQTYIWQEYDLAPDFPELHRFLDFWEHRLEGKLHSVRVACAEFLTGQDWRYAGYFEQVH
ncbi:MAG TPA: Usg family protein [Dongiaceae bacterium]|jgi:uncharacterized protein Usg|nr:Usg family protein [Dongiaceae bacterium]